MKLPVGPWLGQLKAAIRQEKEDSIFSIDGKKYAFSDLVGIADISRGQKLSYVVDLLGSKDNIGKVIQLVRGSDVLYIEACFLEKDKDRARDRYHLTAREAGRIAAEAGVRRFEILHFSPRYADFPWLLQEEADEEFRMFQG